MSRGQMEKSKVTATRVEHILLASGGKANYSWSSEENTSGAYGKESK